jgi:acetyl esterase/lipase
MSVPQRRKFLALSGALMVSRAMASTSATARLSPPAPPKVLSKDWLSAPRIALWPGDPPGAAGFTPQPLPSDSSPSFLRNIATPDLRVFHPRRPNGRALLVVPGGAYWFVSSANEGLDVARRMTACGVTVYVLTYRLPGEGWQNRADVPLQDAQRALRVIRSRASQLGIDPHSVSVLGFSAGGHLAATLATAHSEVTYAPVDPADEIDPRPAAAGLIYPVVTMEKPLTHEMSRKLLLGESPSDAEVARRSPERHVDSTTPPAFLVHAFDDPAVPVENSLRFMNAMRSAQRPVEAHLLQEGGHAFGVGYPGSPSGEWIELFWNWLQRAT